MTVEQLAVISLSAFDKRCGVLLIALLGCVPALAQQASLEPVQLPATAMPLPADTGESSSSDTAVAADGVDEVVVTGRSMAFLRERVEIAEDKLYSVYNDLNAIEEFDIHCRMHAVTGTRMLKRVCVPNFEKKHSAEKGRAVLAAFRGEAFGTDWQSAENEMRYKIPLLEQHMQKLALENPMLLDAMRELYDAMQSLSPRRYGREAEQ